ncbi:MAG TPA: response regulator [Gemmatimonadaceae bacterium]|nr:response regulator [Gemmatimonadaceae bacterium]
MTRKILIVDDERQMVRTLSDIVRMHGWQPSGAFSGEAAVEEVRKGSYDAVLMDVKMAGINGVMAFREMKRIRPNIRVVLMTAYTAADIIAEAEREGALKVLAKPVQLSGLIEMLEATTRQMPPVLLIADDVALLRDLCKRLEEHGYDTLEATSLEKALDTLEKSHPAAVVLDLRLDGISHEESIVAIKRVSPGVALILCTAKPGANGNGKHASKRLIHASLSKPFAPEKLIEILDDIFEG